LTSRHPEKVQFIWEIAELLRGDYKRYEYGKVVLPFAVLRRLDCVLEATKKDVLNANEELPARLQNREPALLAAAGQSFYNLSPLDMPKLLHAPEELKENLQAYIRAFSADARDVLDKFDFPAQIERLAKAGLLFKVVSKFSQLDLHRETVSNIEMGLIFEELIRKFSEQSNETAGEHFTPREVIRLMVNLLFIEDSDLLTTPGTIATMLDPAAGTGGMLSVAQNYLRELNDRATLKTFGQELNEESYAICKADLMIKGQDPSSVKLGNSFTEDRFKGQQFDYLIANPPFGVDWGKVEDEVRREHEVEGHAGRFGPGLPRKTDGQLLFLLHMISKMRSADGRGSRAAIVFNGSPLFSGGAGSGESEIRRWIIENDWLEAVVALPDQLFYNTGISTYIWIVTNRKSDERRGKVQLVDGRDFFVKMDTSLGDKRNRISDEQSDQLTRLYGDFVDGDHVKVLPNEAFGYRRITIEQPKRVSVVGGEEAAGRLLSHSDWNDERAVRKSSLDDADQIRAEVLATLRAMPADGMKLQDAVEQLEAMSAWKPLLKKAREAVLDSLFIEDAGGEPLVDAKGVVVPDTDRRVGENVPLLDDVEEHFRTEVAPHVDGAWIDEEREKLGYEIAFRKIFFEATEPRPIGAIESDIKALESEMVALIQKSEVA